jgi:hypothetical protein
LYINVLNLKALSVDNGRTRFIVFFLGDPHGLESGKGSKDGSANPYRVFSLWGSDNLDLHGGRGKVDDLLLHTVGNTWEHGCSSRKDDVSVEVLSDIDVAFHDGVVSALVDTSSFTSEERRLEEGFRASESFVSNSDDLTVGQFVALFKGRGVGSGFHLGVEVEGNIAKLFLDVTDDFSLGSGGESITSLGEDLHEVVSEITSSQVQSHDGVGEGITFVDGDGVADTITDVKNDSGGTSRSVKGKYGLDGNIHGGAVESLEHDLGHLFSVGLRVQWGLSEENGVLFRGNSKLIVKGMMPDLFHIVPVGNNTVFNGVFEGQDTSLGLSFITDV